jgi:hypothetical protein
VRELKDPRTVPDYHDHLSELLPTSLVEQHPISWAPIQTSPIVHWVNLALRRHDRQQAGSVLTRPLPLDDPKKDGIHELSLRSFEETAPYQKIMPTLRFKSRETHFGNSL